MVNLLFMPVTWITFPGVILHEWSHKLFCDLAGIPVYEVRYFRLGNPAGYVRHGGIQRYRDALLITVAPFIVNSLGAVLAFLPVVTGTDVMIRLACAWLGVSFAMHALPSDGDAKGLWKHTWRSWRRNPAALLGVPVVAAIMLANLLRVFWFDMIYAVVLFGVALALAGAAGMAGPL